MPNKFLSTLHKNSQTIRQGIIDQYPPENDELNQTMQESINPSSKYDDTTYLSSIRQRFKSENIIQLENDAFKQLKVQSRLGKKSFQGNIERTSRSLRKNHRVQKSSVTTSNIEIGSIPTVHQLLRERDKIADIFTKAANKFKYSQMLKEKKLKSLNTKRTKCQRIMRIRQNSVKEKEYLNFSRMEFQNFVKAQKMRLKNSVSDNKKNTAKSLLDSFVRKHEIAGQIKNQKNLERQIMKRDRDEDLNKKKSMHASIMAAHQEHKNKKNLMLEEKKRMATENYSSKLIIVSKKYSSPVQKQSSSPQILHKNEAIQYCSIQV